MVIRIRRSGYVVAALALVFPTLALLLAGGCGSGEQDTSSAQQDGSAHFQDASLHGDGGAPDGAPSGSDGSARPSGPPSVGDVLDTCSGFPAFPADAGVLNVIDFGADPTGATDSTTAIQRAISAVSSLYGPYSDGGGKPYVNPLSAPNYYNRIIYFPAGMYVVSDTLERRIHDQMSKSMVTALADAGETAEATLIATNGRYINGMVLVGDCWKTTTLKLKDALPAFGDAAAPKAVIYQASTLYDDIGDALNQYGDFVWAPIDCTTQADLSKVDAACKSGNDACTQCVPGDTVCASKNSGCRQIDSNQLVYVMNNGNAYVTTGGGADAYDNFIVNLTIDVGSGNPGAIGIDTLANNDGAIRNVVVQAPPGSGLTGISATRADGPTVMEKVAVSGFATGIDVTQDHYSITLEHILLSGQTTVALQNQQNGLAIHDLNIETDGGIVPIANLAPPTDGSGLVGQIVLIGGEIWGAVDSDPLQAIKNAGFLDLRAVSVADGGTADGVYGPGNVVLASPSTQSWSLPIKDPPAPPPDDPATWANVVELGADPTGDADCTDAVVHALQSGKSTIFFPGGQYQMQTTAVPVPPSVHRILGAASTIRFKSPDSAAGELDDNEGIFQISGAGDVTIENLFLLPETGAKASLVEQKGSGAVVLRDIWAGSGYYLLYRDPAVGETGGETYFEDVNNTIIQLDGTAGAWGRMINIERNGSPAVDAGAFEPANIVNNGGGLWLLGTKTEKDETVVQNIGGTTEVLGGELYPVASNYTSPTGQSVDLRNVPAFINQSGGHLAVSLIEQAVAKLDGTAICTDAGNTTVDTARMAGVAAYSILVGTGAPGTAYVPDVCTYPFRDGTPKVTGAVSNLAAIVVPQYVSP